MRISGRLCAAVTTLSSLLALQAGTPVAAAIPIGPVGGALTVPASPHRFIGFPAATQRVSLMYHLPLRNRAQLEALTIMQGTPGSQAFEHWLTPAQFQAQFAPDSASVAAAVRALRDSGLSVDRVGHQMIYVSAPAATIERAFSTKLGVAKDVVGKFVAARTAYHIPAELARLPGTLLGLAALARPRPHYALSAPRPLNRYGPEGPYWFDDLKQAYSYPTYAEANGKGRNIGIVGASDFNESDAYYYFGNEGVGNYTGALAPAPVLTHNLFAGAEPWDPNSGASFEADLDVQQSGGSAPGAEIDSYDVDSTESEGFLAAYAQIVEADYDDIVSTSYGGCELLFTPAFNNGITSDGVLKAYHDIFLEGNAYGITFLFSSGDDAARECAPLGYFEQQSTSVTYNAIPGVSFWADDPSVTAVGGTNLKTTATSGSLDSAYVSEQEIADAPLQPEDPYGTGNELQDLYFGSGGGQSVIWPRPSYQTAAHVNGISGTGRLLPDVSMHMGGCPSSVLATAPCVTTGRDSADLVSHDGSLYGVIGTSASTPEFAGLLAVLEQLDGGKRLGNVNGLLYAVGNTTVFHQGIVGADGVAAYDAPLGKTGYNLVTGLGTPIATALLTRVTGKKLTPAGLPQTASNP